MNNSKMVRARHEVSAEHKEEVGVGLSNKKYFLRYRGRLCSGGIELTRITRKP
jgi:hypothetical protein